jgi:SagB-type dehydrogenase family enzyme
LCEVARYNLQGNGFSFETLQGKAEVDYLLAELISLGVLSKQAQQGQMNRTNGYVTLLELATLRMSQVGGCYEPSLKGNYEAPPRFEPVAEAVGTLQLPETKPRSVDLWLTMRKRRSRRNGGERQASVHEISMILSYSSRIHESGEDAFGEISFRCAASGGARHPVELFLAIMRVPGLEQGVYQYDPRKHQLRLLKTAKQTAELLLLLSTSAMGQRPATLPGSFFIFVGVPDRTACKYRNNALLTIAKDVGCLIQQLYLTVEGLGLVGCAINGLDPAQTEVLLGLDTARHAVLGGFVVW